MSHAPYPRRTSGNNPRKQVFCHECQQVWFRDEHGLRCPECRSEFTQLVDEDDDPRQDQIPEDQHSPLDHPLNDHNQWDRDHEHNHHVPDPEEPDIEEHVRYGPAGSMTYTRIIRGPAFRGPNPGRGPDDQAPQRETDNTLITHFQEMMSAIMGPNMRPGQVGRTEEDILFGGTRDPLGGHPLGQTPGPGRTTTTFGPVIRGRFTYSPPRLFPRDADHAQPHAEPVDDLTRFLETFMAPMTPNAQVHGISVGPPVNPLTNLIAAIINPANAAHGDAVYTQEALDRVISNLMEQNPSSNAPGPASPEAIAALRKKRADDKILGVEGKAECSVCMDDVKLGEEVTILPCKHWFHGPCVSAWLGEHDTCPICRKGITNAEPHPSSAPASGSASTPPPAPNPHPYAALNRPGSGLFNRNLGPFAPHPPRDMAPESNRARAPETHMRERYEQHSSTSQRSSRDNGGSTSRTSGGGSGGGGGVAGWLRSRLGGGSSNHNNS